MKINILVKIVILKEENILEIEENIINDKNINAMQFNRYIYLQALSDNYEIILNKKGKNQDYYFKDKKISKIITKQLIDKYYIRIISENEQFIKLLLKHDINNNKVNISNEIIVKLFYNKNKELLRLYCFIFVENIHNIFIFDKNKIRNLHIYGRIKINSSNGSIIQDLAKLNCITYDYYLKDRDQIVCVIATNKKSCKFKIPKKINNNMLNYIKREKENNLKNFLMKNLDLIESGMELINIEYKINKGKIDILAKDKNNIKCIIELKVVSNCTDLIFQSVYYPTQFKEKVRMITICPKYDYKILTSLNQISYVEKKYYKMKNDDFKTLKIYDI